MEKLFKFKQYGTNLSTEIIAGLTTFFTMAYIMIVNPNILSNTGMNKNGVFVATIICTVIGTLVMAFVANVPYALAPGMGLNAFFTYTVCLVMGFTWQAALALVLVCGLVNTIITVTSFRKEIIKAIPKTLQCAIAGGIGMFIAYIGIKDAGLLHFSLDPKTYVVFSSGSANADASAVPALVNFSGHAVQVAIIGLFIMIVLMVLRVKGSILIGIIATTIIGIPFGVTTLPDLHNFWGSFTSSVSGIQYTFFKLDFASLVFKAGVFSWGKLLLAITAGIGFCLTDIFDTIGTFLGTGRKTGIFDEKDMELFNNGGRSFKSRMDRALFADLIATTTGAFFGTSNTTTYVESSAGIAAGGRTGFTSVITAACFAVCILLAPIVGMVPSAATAPALIVVGVLMMSSFSEINWSDFEEACPAFLAAVFMPFAYSITTGIGIGFITYTVVKVFKGKYKEVHPIVYGVCALFIVNYVLLAVKNL